MNLQDALLLLTSGGAGALVAWLMENIDAIVQLRPDYKRYLSWLLSCAIPIAAWGAMLLLGYEAQPASLREVIERVFALLFVAFSSSQGTHAVVYLRKRALREAGY